MKELVHSTKAVDLFSVAGKRVFLSGVGGLGSYLAKGFLANGAKLVIADVDGERATAAKEEFQDEGYTDCLAFQMDQTNKQQIEEVVGLAVRQIGGIDVLINAGAICVNQPTESFDEALLRKIVEVNITGAMLLTQVVGSHMISRGQGKIILIGSISGIMPDSDDGMPYQTSKAAIHQITRTCAAAWGKYGINVNCLAPTWIDNSPMLKGCDPNVLRSVTKAHCFDRLAVVEDYLGPALFLASEASTYMTGHILVVDGGWSSAKPYIL